MVTLGSFPGSEGLVIGRAPISQPASLSSRHLNKRRPGTHLVVELAVTTKAAVEDPDQTKTLRAWLWVLPRLQCNVVGARSSGVRTPTQAGIEQALIAGEAREHDARPAGHLR